MLECWKMSVVLGTPQTLSRIVNFSFDFPPHMSPLERIRFIRLCSGSAASILLRGVQIPRFQPSPICQRHIKFTVSREVEIGDCKSTLAPVVVFQTLQTPSVHLSQICTLTPPFSTSALHGHLRLIQSPSPTIETLPAPSLYPYPASNLSGRFLGDRMPYKQPIQKHSYENDAYRDRDRVGYDLCLGHFRAGR